jgi:hypothetical protein
MQEEVSCNRTARVQVDLDFPIELRDAGEGGALPMWDAREAAIGKVGDTVLCWDLDLEVDDRD